MNKLKGLGSLAVIALLAACGDSDKASATQTGQLVDAAVEGVSYTTSPGGKSGITDANGNYNYLPGDRVIFRIGNIVFPAVDAKGTVTPLDIAGTTDINNTVVANIARLLQTLDADSIPSNGITILADITGSAYDFTLSTTAFEAAFKADFPTTPMVALTDALDHLQLELDALDGSISTVSAGTGPNETVATIPSSIVGTYELTFDETNTGSGIIDGSMETFVVSSDGSLRIGDTTLLVNPVLYRGNEQQAIWKDEIAGLFYVLSSLTDGFNEIKVSKGVHYDQPGAQLYGQYRMESSSNPLERVDLVTQLAGDYRVTEVVEGAHTGMKITLTSDGSLNFDTGLSFPIAEADQIYDRVSTLNAVYVGYGAINGFPNARVDYQLINGQLSSIIIWRDNFGSANSFWVAVEPLT